MSAPVPAARYALTVFACAVILAAFLATVSHLLGQPSP